MRAILRFNFDIFEDKLEHMRCLKATDLALTLSDMDEWLRGEVKYHDKPYQEVRDRLREILNERGVDLDDMLR